MKIHFTKTKLSLLALLFTITGKAQFFTYPIDTTGLQTHSWVCGNDTGMFNHLMDTVYANPMARYNSVSGTTSTSYTVPVVVHIITPPSYSITVTYQQVQWAIAALNAQYQNQLLQFTGHAPGPRAVSANVEFRLACRPMPATGTNTATVNGLAGWTNATEPGVVRYTTTNTVVLNQPVVDPSSPASTYTPMISMTNPTGFFPQADYLNIYLVPNIYNSNPNGTILGFSTFPWWTISSGGLTMDGIVMRIDAFGSNYYPNNFPLNPNWNIGNTLAHEAGHYLGLYHTFQPNSGGNFNVPIGCYGTTVATATTDGDLLLDTPPTRVSGDLGTVTAINTCNENNYPYGVLPDENDQLENNMCYSSDLKRNTFTTGQATRMTIALNGTRANLVSNANLTATGVAGATACSNYTKIVTGIFNSAIAVNSTCAAIQIQFTNPTSTGFNVGGTTYSWTFGDGGTSTSASPVHTYTTQSTFTVSCTATNGTVTNTYSTTVTTNMSVSIAGQNAQLGLNTVSTVCKGTEQTLYIQFGIGVPSATITDGTTQTVVHNYLDLTHVETIPYMFTANSTVSYSLVPSSCGGVSGGSATFNVIDCCPTMITNGDFESGNTGFASDLAYNANYATTPLVYYLTNAYGAYGVDLMSNVLQFSTGAPHIATTGKVMCVDGFQGNNGIVNVYGCNSGSTPRVWQQVITGLLPNTPYYFSYKVTQNDPANYYCPTGQTFQSSIASSTAIALAAQTFSPLNAYTAAATSPTSITWAYDVASYSFTTSGTVSPTDNFSVTLNQYNNFEGYGYDYSVDNILLQKMTPPIQAIGNATICAGSSSPLTATANCGASLTNYSYTWLPSSSVACYTCSSTSATPTATTVYTLVATPTFTANPSPPNFVSTVTVTINTISITPTSTAICLGQTVNLSASGATGYTWTPGATLSCTNCANPNATPTSTTIYTVTGVASPSCAVNQTVSVTVHSLPSLTVVAVPVPLCTGQTATLTASGASTYHWNNGANTASISNVINTPGVKSFTVTGTDIYGCSSVLTSTINAYATPTISIVASPTAVCVNQSSTLTASGASTYTWTADPSLSTTTGSVVAATPSVNTTYTIVGTSTNNCTASNTVSLTVNSCTVCPTCTASIAATVTVNPSSGGSYCINNQNTIISGNITFTTSEFKIAPNVTITINPGSSLTINNCHLYACSNMWAGIVVNNTSTLTINNNSFIEDAITAVTSSPGSSATPVITFSTTIFNKNYTSLNANTYTGYPASGYVYPLSVTNCVFTSRSITTTTSTTMPNWPTVATVATPSVMPSLLQSPYLNAYSVTTCKNGGYPLFGFNLNQNGQTTGSPTTPVYYEFYIGQGASGMANIFDTHYYDIYTINTNLTVVNSVFQNGLYQAPFFGNPEILGGGVVGGSNLNYWPIYTVTDYRVRLMPGSGTSYANSFYNLYKVCDLNGLLETNISYNNCYSTAGHYYGGMTLPMGGHINGETGISITSNRYKQITVDHNTICNISHPILFTADVASYYNNPSGGVSVGRYGGQVDITNNYIRPNTPSVTVGDQSVVLGISVNDLMSSPGSYTNTTVTGSNININSNTIDKVYNGIYGANFGLQPVNTYSNYVTIVDYPGYSSPTNQYGIQQVNTKSSIINYNNISSAVTNTLQAKGITTASNATLSVQCNNETGAWRGIEFNGTEATTFVGNQLSSNTYGMVLDNSAILGTQGNSGNPRWDQWNGSWGTSNTTAPFKTYVAGSSSAQNSKIWIKNTGTYNPDGNGGVDGLGFLGTDNYFHTGASPTINYASYSGTWTCPNPVPTCTNCRGAQQPAMSAEDSVEAFNAMELKEKVAMNAIKYNASDSSLNRYMSKMTIYRQLRADTNAIFGSRIVRAFYNRMQNSNTEKLFQIEDAFLNGDYATAQNLSASFNAKNIIETNHLTYYTALSNYAQHKMSSSDSANLLTLAQGCPFKDGMVVYQARALYNVTHSPYTMFTDNCSTSGSSDRVSENETQPVINFDAEVYPNPNAGKEIFIAPISLTIGSLQIKLTDLEGRIVFEANCTVTDGLSNLKITDIKNGVYFVHITNTITGEKVVKKLVIQY